MYAVLLLLSGVKHCKYMWILCWNCIVVPGMPATTGTGAASNLQAAAAAGIQIV